MLSAQNVSDLQVKGYTVVPGVIPTQQCDDYVKQFHTWLGGFDVWPKSRHGIIHGHSSGHLEATWQVRLQAKDVFSQIWKTEKLLSSFDSIAIGRPPEDGVEPFDTDGKPWLHLDQESFRDGLHAYQGGVYLEEACHDDWTLQVMEGSHAIFKKFFDENPKAAQNSAEKQFFLLNKTFVKYFEKHGCKIVRIPVPKGGMVLWDSRLVHANAEPLEGRQNSGRWRYVVFVSMTPAMWASEEDLDVRREAYAAVKTTNHWSSAGSTLTKASLGRGKARILALPPAANTREAQLISAILPYDFDDGKPNGPPKPAMKYKADQASK